MSLVQVVVFADEHDGVIPEIFLRKMLCQPFQNAVGFADICQTFFVCIVRFAEQDVNAGIVHILSVRALADTRSRDTVCFSIPVGQFATDTPFRGAIHQKQCYFLAVRHLERIIFAKIRIFIEMRLWDD